jgi:carbonic anhydrase
MCNSLLDKRALSLFLILSNDNNFKKIKHFKKWLELNKNIKYNFSSVEDRIKQSAIQYFNMTEENIADDYAYITSSSLDRVLSWINSDEKYRNVYIDKLANEVYNNQSSVSH